MNRHEPKILFTRRRWDQLMLPICIGFSILAVLLYVILNDGIYLAFLTFVPILWTS